MIWKVRKGFAFHANEFIRQGYGEEEEFEAEAHEIEDQKWKVEAKRQLSAPPIKRKRGRPRKNVAFSQPPQDRSMG